MKFITIIITIFIIFLLWRFIKPGRIVNLRESFMDYTSQESSMDSNNNKICKLSCDSETYSPSPPITGGEYQMCKRIGFIDGGTNYKTDSNLNWYDAEEKCLSDPLCKSFVIQGEYKGKIKYYSNSIPIQIPPGQWKAMNYSNLYVKTDQKCMIPQKASIANSSFNPSYMNPFVTQKYNYFDDYFNNKLNQSMNDSNNQDLALMSQGYVNVDAFNDGKWHVMGTGQIKQLAYNPQNDIIYALGTDYKLYFNYKFSTKWNVFEKAPYSIDDIDSGKVSDEEVSQLSEQDLMKEVDVYLDMFTTYFTILDGYFYQLIGDTVIKKAVLPGSNYQQITPNVFNTTGLGPIQAYNNRIYGISKENSIISYPSSVSYNSIGEIDGFETLSNSCCVIDFKIVKDIIYAILSDNSVYSKGISSTSNWTKLSGPFVKKIQINNDLIYAIGGHGYLYVMPITGGAWTLFNNSQTIIDFIIIDEYFFGVGTDFKYYILKKNNSTTQQNQGQSIQF